MSSRARFGLRPQFNSWGILLSWVVQLVLVVCLLDLPGCGNGEVGGGGSEMLTQSVAGCTVSTVRYPTTEMEFSRLYALRDFLVDDVHIGRDINLPEGTAIYPIACGTIRVYRAADGYGTLVAVVEHHLATPITVQNGVGERVSVQDFLSIYGHLRPTTSRTGGARLPWRDGDTVRPDQIIGYVQHAADNGDGDEHLHFGIRLQTMTEAARIDPAAWFAGYDRDRVRRRWYASPGPFMSALMRRSVVTSTSTWHPTGTVLSVSGEYWLVVSDGMLTRLTNDVVQSERFGTRVVSGIPAEIACMMTLGFSLERTNSHRLVRFEGGSTVYEYAEAPSPMRYTFLAQQAFDSWGWNNSQIEVRGAGERTAFLARYRDLGSRRLREGSLVKAAGRSDVYVVSQGARRPIFDWPTFLALGYDEAWIIEVDSSVLDVLAGPLGEVIRPEDLRRCRSTPTPMDAGVPVMDAALPRDVSAGVDTSIDATVDVPAGVSVRDVPTYHDAGLSPMDAGVSLMDAGRDAMSDLGLDPRRDAGSCTDPPRDAGGGAMDAGVPDSGSLPSLDASVADIVDVLPVVGVLPGAVMRYEFRLATDSENWRPTEPYHLRDQWWRQLDCLNAIDSDRTRMVAQGGGWYRCDTAEIQRIFVGTFFSPSHPTLGDRGHIPTIDNWPRLCNPRLGVEWRISELPSGREVYRGSSSGLPCENVSEHSRHRLP